MLRATITILLLSQVLLGQDSLTNILLRSTANLVPNAGFEYSWKCPSNFSQVHFANGWSMPTTGSADYYNACGTKEYSVPNNRYGEKSPFEGEAYMALHGRENGAEYIQIRLASPLEKGEKYYCSIAISACERFPAVCSDVGLLFTKEKVERDNGGRITEYQPQIENHPDSNFIDYEWHVVKGFFTAKGGEQYLTIGSFSKNVSPISTKDFSVVTGVSWYNFIDNISTKPVYRKRPKKKIQDLFNRLENINFTNRSYELDTSTFPGLEKELKKVLNILKRDKDISIKVIGHTDNNGSKSSNKTLSLNRCLAVQQYLVNNGIAKKRIKVLGKGDSEPILPNTTQENKKKNRRVEFKVI